MGRGWIFFHGALLALAGAACSEPPGRARTIVLISVDTLRPERLGVYGNTSDVSPNLDALASAAVVFEEALTVSPWTLPSHMSMLTGLDPVAHGVVSPKQRLAAGVSTLAERLSQAGYRTAAFTGGGYVEKIYGFDQGFELYESHSAPEARGFAHTVPRALAWLDAHADEDCFLFLHTFDVHSPYSECDPEILARFRARPVSDGPLDPLLFRSQYLESQIAANIPSYGRLAELFNDYDAGVNEADRGIGLVLERLRASGRFDDALVIVTSDHGESFFDRGQYVGHGIGLTDDEVRVPLVVKLPHGAGAGSRRAELVDLLDLAPTVLAAARVSPEAEWRGQDLGELARGEPRRERAIMAVSSSAGRYALVRDGFKYLSPGSKPPSRVALSHLGPRTPELLGPDAAGAPYELGAGASVMQLRYDLAADPLGVRDALTTDAHLFDRRRDPAEQRDILADEPEVARRMALELRELVQASDRIAAQVGAASEVALTGEQERELARLGYLSTEPGARPEVVGAIELLETSPRADKGPKLVPDVSALLAADRSVHAIRLRLRERAPLAADTRAQLEGAALAYARWGREHPEHAARSRWRRLELEALAREAGVELDLAAIDEQSQ